MSQSKHDTQQRGTANADFDPRSPAPQSSENPTSPQQPSNPTPSQPPPSSSPPALHVGQWEPRPSTNRFPMPRLVEFWPSQGAEGDTIQVTLAMSSTDMVTMLQLAFGSCMAATHSTVINPTTQLVTLSAQAPSWPLTRTPNRDRVPVYVTVVAQQEVLDGWCIAYFNYASGRKRSSVDYTTLDSTKRTRRDNEASLEESMGATGYMVPGYPEYYGLPPSQYMYASHLPSASSRRPTASYMEDINLASSDMLGYPSYPSPRQPSSMEPSTLGFPRDPSGDIGMSPPSSSGMSLTPVPSQQPGSGLNPSDTVPQYMLQSEQMRQHLPQQLQSVQVHIRPQPSGYMEPMAPGPPLSAHSAAPPIAPAAGGVVVPMPLAASQTTASPGVGQYDPFAHILNRADLQVQGDLNTMMTGWTETEKQHQRRLVRFWRRQEDNNVICSFAPVSPDERPSQQTMIVVSCIYWENRNDYYITSVDCIYLLESLIGVRFTVEEKNRIRRNLEGFKPLTASKQREDSADFFKLIMGFPNPKPRNIEKDVKVFAWSSLGDALKKIISKYTASYSSTASVNLEALGSPPS